MYALAGPAPAVGGGGYGASSITFWLAYAAFCGIVVPKSWDKVVGRKSANEVSARVNERVAGFKYIDIGDDYYDETEFVKKPKWDLRAYLVQGGRRIRELLRDCGIHLSSAEVILIIGINHVGAFVLRFAVTKCGACSACCRFCKSQPERLQKYDLSGLAAASQSKSRR